MAMGKRPSEQQEQSWIATGDMPQDGRSPVEVVTEKGYHSNNVLRDLCEVGY